MKERKSLKRCDDLTKEFSLIGLVSVSADDYGQLGLVMCHTILIIKAQEISA